MFLPVLCLCCGVFFFAPVFLALFPVCVLCDAKSVKMLNIHSKTRQPNKARKRGSLTLEQTQQYAENEGRWPCVMKFDASWGVCFVSDDRCGAPCGFVGRSGSGGCFVVSCVFVPAAVRVFCVWQACRWWSCGSLSLSSRWRLRFLLASVLGPVAGPLAV